MKYILILAFIIGGCDKIKSTKSEYKRIFYVYIDSSKCYYQKWLCSWNKGEYTTADKWSAHQDRCSDSVNKYFDLMYPNPEPNSQCDCK